MAFVDQVTVKAVGGRGGDGCISFRREKFVPKGGPDGGDGGKGGSVFLLATADVNTLEALLYHPILEAVRGRHGSSKDRTGGGGADRVVMVPLGVEVWKVVAEEGSEFCGEVLKEGERLLVARGGKGGRGNARFASSTVRSPKLAEAGEEGERFVYKLELKMLADVAIVGKPNAGKSTLLSSVSHAHPKVAPYPFTTTVPVLGIVGLGARATVFAEVPGLLPGAHQGKGLGFQFLRHAERCRMFLFLLDGAQSPAQDLEDVREELRLYKPSLLARPAVVAVNKVDLPEVSAARASLKQSLAGWGMPLHFISAATGDGLPALLKDIDRLLPIQEESQESAQPFRIEARPEEKPFVEEKGGVFWVRYSPAERLVLRIDLEDWQAKTQMMRQLGRMGVLRALRRAGAGPGAIVHIGAVELELEWA